jgi:hypothetical protein
VANLTSLTHKIAIKLHWWQRDVQFAVLVLVGQSGNFRIHRVLNSFTLFPDRRPQPQIGLKTKAFRTTGSLTTRNVILSKPEDSSKERSILH